VYDWPGVFAIYASGNDLWLGGGFRAVGATSSRGIAKVPSDPLQSAPSTPGGFSATAGANAIDLDWNASSDDTGIRGYRVLRSGYQIGFVTATAFSDTTALPGSTYEYHIEAVDDDFNISDRSVRRTATVSGAPPDTQDPAATISAPADGSLQPGPSVSFSGTATDNQGVEEVYTVIRDKNTNLYLQPDLTWGSAYKKIATNLSNQGGTSTNWSISYDLPDGDYWVKAVPKDTSGNIPASKPRSDFEVGQGQPPDTENPAGIITAPAQAATVNGPNVSFSGTATDNVGVNKVFVAIKDKTTNNYLQDDLSWDPAYNRIETNLTNQGATATDWSMSFSLPNGDFFVEVVVKDTSDNKNSPVPRTDFTVV